MKNLQDVLPHYYSFIPGSVRKRILAHPLCRNLFLTEIGYEAETSFHPVAKAKLDNHYLIVYVAKGRGTYEIRKQKFKVIENDFFVVPAAVIEKMESDPTDPWSIYWAYFSGSQATKVVLHLNGRQFSPRQAKPLVGRISQFNDILHHLELMENIENLVYANSRVYSLLC